MKIIKAEVELYEYDELNEESREKAFNEHFDFLIGFADSESAFKGMSLKNERDYVEDSLRINEYLFFNDGELASCVTYTDGHEKTGITEFTFKGKVYEVV